MQAMQERVKRFVWTKADRIDSPRCEGLILVSIRETWAIAIARNACIDVRRMALKPLTERYWKESVSNYLASWAHMTIPEMHQSTAAADAIREFACNALIHMAASNGIRKFTPQQIMGRDMRPGVSIQIDDGDVLRHINFGIYMSEWSIETYLPYPEGLPHMRDGFWSEIASLPTLGQVELFESSPVDAPSEIPQKFMKVKQSVVFQMVRNILFRMQCDPSNAHDIGILITKWPIDTPFVDLMERLRVTYGVYHRCVSQLVKHNKKRKKS